jgi:sirohydrochlorin ferrochelatase
VRSDIPVQVNEVQARYPQLAVTLHPPVGEHPLLVNALVEIAVSTLPGLPASP